MNITDKRLGFLLIPLVIIVIYLFINFLPVILIIGVAVWVVAKGIKFFKEHNNKERKVTYSKKHEDFEVINKEDPFDFTNKKIVDVDYTDVK